MKNVTLGRLPRLFVAILALDEDTRAVVCEAMQEAMPIALSGTIYTLAADLHAILQMPKDERARIAAMLDEMLDDLCSRDAFGTEGQNDPRGDHRN